jgi:hypothetical protein
VKSAPHSRKRSRRADSHGLALGLPCAAAFALVLFVVALNPGPALAGARIVLGERAIDFGMIAPGDLAVREIALANSGDAPLVVAEISAHDAAIRGGARADTIAPGDSTQIVVVAAPGDSGSLETKLLVRTNDPQEPIAAVIVRASVARWHDIDATVRGLGETRPGARDVVKIPYRFRPGTDLRLAGSASTLPFLELEDRATADSVHRFVAVSIAPSAAAGPYEGFVDLWIAGSHPDTVRIAIRGAIVAQWRVQPHPYYAAITKFTKSKPPPIRCERMATSAARIVEATSTLPGWSARLVTIEEGRIYQITLVHEGESKEGLATGEVRIATSDKKQPLVIVPASILVGKAPTP